MLEGAYFSCLSYISGSAFTSIGNAIYFHDPMPTAGEAIQGLEISMLTGGVLNGLSDYMLIEDIYIQNIQRYSFARGINLVTKLRNNMKA